MRYLLGLFLSAVTMAGAPGAARADVAILPPTLHGCGIVTLTSASTPIVAANVTLCANSAPFPTGVMGFPMTAKNLATSGGIATVCWLGGLCGTVGEILAVGEGSQKGVQFLNVAVQPPTATAALGASLYVEW